MSVQHRDWIRTSGDRFVLDPGIPEVQDLDHINSRRSRFPLSGRWRAV
ncbi:hypothetical protein ACLK2B_07960 [Escherichia coli]